MPYDRGCIGLFVKNSRGGLGTDFHVVGVDVNVDFDFCVQATACLCEFLQLQYRLPLPVFCG